MFFAPTAIVLVSLGLTLDPIFGDANRRPIPAVISQLDVLEQLPPDAFALFGGGVLGLVGDAKASVVRVRALQVACARGDAELARRLAAALGSRLDALGSQGRDRVADSFVLQSVSTRRTSRWSEAMRASPEMRAVLMRMATWPLGLQGGGDETASHAAVYRLLELSPFDTAKRAVLMQIVTARGLGAYPASSELIALVDEPSKTALRALLTGQPVNEFAALVLGEIGDPAARQIAEQRLANGITLAEGRSALIDMKWKIEAQTPPEHLINLISTSDPMFMYREWALERAVQLCVSKPAIKDAITSWAGAVQPAQVSFVKHRAIALGVLADSDLPSVPAFAVHGGYGIYDPNAPELPITVPTMRSKVAPWRPTTENLDQFSVWFCEQHWLGISEDEELRRITNKLCDLDLCDPEICAQSANSQPSP